METFWRHDRIQIGSFAGQFPAGTPGLSWCVGMFLDPIEFRLKHQQFSTLLLKHERVQACGKR
jgi:hypothetical protein